jgi:two-component system cell cycle sensor histidine kinase/response regulator CckA
MDTTKSCKVLVVEDEGLIAHDIANRLETLGHQVVATVSTAAEAFEAAAGADIVLMDIRIDGPVDGVEAAAEIRERYHLPVIFLTAHADKATLDRAKLAGPFGYIVKPLGPASLNTSIEIALYKHRMERLLEKSEAMLRTTLGSVADGVVVTDADGRVLMMNHAAEALTGCIQPEAEGQPVANVVRLVDEHSGESLDDPIPLALLRDAPVPLGGSLLVARSGRQMAVEGAVAPVRTSGQALGTVLTFRDVSARRWEERQIRQAQKMEAVGRLAAAVSSDYSNLLAIIRNQAEQLLRQFGEYSPARQAAEEINQAAAAAAQITRRLAGFSMPQVSQTEVLSVNGLIRRLAKLVESVARPHAEVTIRTAPDTGRIRADAAQIEQAVMNLVLHSCTVMTTEGTQSGRLLIETTNAEAPAAGRIASYVLIAITHSAQEADIDNLFEPSSTGDDGLALSIVQSIATEHGGYVSARPSAGGGCRFEMLLPRWTQPALLPRPGAAGEAPSVLLVDHRENVRLQLHNFFETRGYNLLEATDAGEALALGQIHEGTLDLLITEAPLAASLTAELRRAHPAIGVLRIVDGPESSPNDIQRPFTQAALADRVEALLSARPKLESASAG